MSEVVHYSITKHALERYQQRIDASVTTREALAAIVAAGHLASKKVALAAYTFFHHSKFAPLRAASVQPPANVSIVEAGDALFLVAHDGGVASVISCASKEAVVEKYRHDRDAYRHRTTRRRQA